MQVYTVEDLIRMVDESRRTLFILCGLPYSGKTVLARGILEEIQCVYISIDDILKETSYD